MVEEALRRSGVNQINKSLGNKRRDVMRNHGFRKFFIHKCMKAGLTESVWKPLVGHRLPRTDSSYVRLTEEEMLAEYVKAIPLLESDANQRLKQENHELKYVQAQEITQLKARVQELDQWAHRWARYARALDEGRVIKMVSKDKKIRARIFVTEEEKEKKKEC